MIKRLVPLALVAAWIPQAYAFPPCPIEPMEYGPPPGETPVSSTARSVTGAAEPWFKANYQFVGNPAIINRIAPQRAITPAIDPDTGKCRGSGAVPVLDAHTSTGVLQLNPTYAPISGFVLIDLPYLPVVAVHGLDVEYRLRFTVDNDHMQNPDDWLDVVQLDFMRNGSPDIEYQQAISSLYRVRKTQGHHSDARIEIIESNATAPGVYSKHEHTDQIVAIIPLPSDRPHTAISLRWTQIAKQHDIHDASYEKNEIDAVFEVLDASNQVLYSAQLPGQWASMLSMGLLDYNVTDISMYDNGQAIELSNMTLAAKRHD